MRLTITFFLAAGMLGLIFWAWIITPSRVETNPFISGRATPEKIEKIMKSTDIEFLRSEAIGMTSNEAAIERDTNTMKVINILTITLLIAIAVQILLFVEIAARGRSRQQRKQ